MMALITVAMVPGMLTMSARRVKRSPDESAAWVPVISCALAARLGEGRSYPWCPEKSQ